MTLPGPRKELLLISGLIFVKDVRRRPDGGWLVERFALAGESPTQLESLELPERDAARLPHPGKIYLAAPDSADAIPSTMLHPLAVYDPDEGMVLFLNARRKQRTEYLSYTNGRHFDRDDLGEERRVLLARILDSPVDEADLARWEADARSEQEQTEPAPAEEPPLRSLGEFELLSDLGRGNMGVVYRAWQPSLGRQVALKRSLRTGDPKTEERFQREIRAMGRVDHPHLVKVFSSGFEGEHWYYAMELVEAATLSAVCDALQSRSSTAADVDLVTWRASLSTACEAARQGEKSVGGSEPTAAPAPRPPHSDASTQLPSPGHDYVRQVLSVGAIDHRTDVYSLGATLWELLTLRPLFGATDATPTPQLMESITIGDYAHIRRYNPKISRDLDAIVQSAW